MKESLSGIGDAAFVGMAKDEMPTVVVFRKGSRAVRLSSTDMDAAGERVVTDAQLRELADLIASRM